LQAVSGLRPRVAATLAARTALGRACEISFSFLLMSGFEWVILESEFKESNFICLTRFARSA